ncbi:MAG: glycosyltransferase family 2 protein [Anaerolineales bacterium]|nr:glycosyltransferase family 2 protein [Anaerolineales bacterium]
MTMKINHISVCICTFKKPNFLKRLLDAVDHQLTEGLFTYSVVVADNDYRQSAKQIVSEFAATSSIPVIYCVEPEQNIALARNKALENSTGDFIAFIDDDEIPGREWLCNLFKTCDEYGVDGVLGPVKPNFEHEPPQWVIKGQVFERPTHETGYRMNWSETRTGNVLFRREILDGINYAFRSEFGTGSEDVDFFRRMIGNGKIFVWCNNAAVYETVPPVRCKRSYLLRLALLRGGNSLKHRTNRVRNILKSLIAIPVYGLALPFLFVAANRYFMKYLIKFFDHAGRLLALLGVNPVKKRVF